MIRTSSFVASTCLGAAAMYFADRGQGARRRAMGRDRMRHIMREGGEMMGAVARHLANRARGTVAGAHQTLAGGDGVSDDILIARIRARIGHVTSHPHGIDVTVSAGRVTLAGHVAAHEMTPLLEAVSAVRGVVEVDNSLTVQPNNILALRPRTSGKNHREAIAAAVFGAAAAGALLAMAPRPHWR